MGAILKLWEVDAGVLAPAASGDSTIFPIGPAGADQSRVNEFAETAVVCLASDAAFTFTMWQAQKRADLPLIGAPGTLAFTIQSQTVYAPAATITPVTINLALPFVKANFVVGVGATTFLRIYAGIRFR